MKDAVTVLAILFVVNSAIALWEFYKRGEKAGRAATSRALLAMWGMAVLVAIAWLVALPFGWRM